MGETVRSPFDAFVVLNEVKDPHFGCTHRCGSFAALKDDKSLLPDYRDPQGQVLPVGLTSVTLSLYGMVP